jgi:hypothetical protein
VSLPGAGVPIVGRGGAVPINLPRMLPIDMLDLRITVLDSDGWEEPIEPPSGSGWCLINWQVSSGDPDRILALWARPKGVPGGSGT